MPWLRNWDYSHIALAWRLVPTDAPLFVDPDEVVYRTVEACLHIIGEIACWQFADPSV